MVVMTIPQQECIYLIDTAVHQSLCLLLECMNEKRFLFTDQMCYKKVSNSMVHDCMDTCKMGYGSNNTIGMPSAIRVEK